MNPAQQRKTFDVWSRRFIREMGVCETMEEWASLIIENARNLWGAEQHNPPAHRAALAAIKENVERIEACLATTSSASTVRETAESTPSTSTASDPPSGSE